MVEAAEHLGVGAGVDAGQVEEGDRVAAAEVEEEVGGARQVAVLEHRGEREAEHVLVEAGGALHVAADRARRGGRRGRSTAAARREGGGRWRGCGRARPRGGRARCVVHLGSRPPSTTPAIVGRRLVQARRPGRPARPARRRRAPRRRGRWPAWCAPRPPSHRSWSAGDVGQLGPAEDRCHLGRLHATAPRRGDSPAATTAAPCRPWRSSRSAFIWCTACAFGASGTGRARHPANTAAQAGRAPATTRPASVAEPGGVEVVGHVLLGPGGAARRELGGGLSGPASRRCPAPTACARWPGSKNVKAALTTSASTSPSTPPRPVDVEVEALEAELGAPLVGVAVEHEVAAHRAHRAWRCWRRRRVRPCGVPLSARRAPTAVYRPAEPAPPDHPRRYRTTRLTKTGGSSWRPPRAQLRCCPRSPAWRWSPSAPTSVPR